MIYIKEQRQVYRDIPQSLKDRPFYGLELDDEQKDFRDAIWDSNVNVIICNAKAGTGKTTIAVGTANMLYNYGLYNGITYIISPTQEQVQGFIPGGPEEKSAPYMEPLIGTLIDLGINPNTAIVSEKTNAEALKSGEAYIECKAHTYMRGINLSKRIIIVDEAENFYLDSLVKVITRIHDDCKLIIIGHDKQCDIIKHPERSGFIPYLEFFKELSEENSNVRICNLTTNHRGWISTQADSIYEWLKRKI